MSDQVRKHIQLIENAHMSVLSINEGYEDRVAQMADEILQMYGQGEPSSKDAIRDAILHRAHSVPLGTLKPTEFANDVIKHLGNKIKIKRKTPAASSRNLALAALKKLILEIAGRVDSELGNQFPDGDPHDIAVALARRYNAPLRDIMYDLSNYGNVREWFFDVVWPKVMVQYKKDHHGNDLHAELADWWDSHRADLIHDAEMQGIDPAEYLPSHGFGGRNPYR